MPRRAHSRREWLLSSRIAGVSRATRGSGFDSAINARPRAASGGGYGIWFVRLIGNGRGLRRQPLSFNNIPLREPAENTTLLGSLGKAWRTLTCWKTSA
jgi:hypothetical protein